MFNTQTSEPVFCSPRFISIENRQTRRRWKMPPGKLSLVSVLTHSLPGPHKTDTHRVSGPLASVPDYKLSLNITLFIYYERPGNPLLGQSIFVAGAMIGLEFQVYIVSKVPCWKWYQLKFSTDSFIKLFGRLQRIFRS